MNRKEYGGQVWLMSSKFSCLQGKEKWKGNSSKSLNN
jgi:hypothetical protein